MFLLIQLHTNSNIPNVRGLRTKLHDVISNFPILNYDIFILTETWLSSHIVDAELGFTGFT
ncbi:DDE-1 domain-containing protein, partial [Aphis craccivora]